MNAFIDRLNAYYQNVYTYLLSDQDRRERNILDERQYIFGNTPIETLLYILSHVGATKDDVFYDIGSGAGQVVLVASRVCKHAFGIEILPRLHDASVQAVKRLGVENVTCYLDDFCLRDMSDGTVFFAYSTTWTPEVRHGLALQVARASSGSRIITVTHPLEHPLIEIIDKQELSWGESLEGGPSLRTAYFQRVR